MEENETIIQQFGQGTKKLCNLQSMVMTIAIHDRGHGSKLERRLCIKRLVWSRPQQLMVATTKFFNSIIDELVDSLGSTSLPVSAFQPLCFS